MKLFTSKTQYILTENGIDLSLPIRNGNNNVNAWHCDPIRIEPVVSGDFIGDVNQGGSVNFKNITLSPHGNGTHTECVGHISKEPYTINQSLKEFHFLAQLISIKPTTKWSEDFNIEDQIIDLTLIKEHTSNWKNQKALIIRTLENPESKKEKKYSDTNPPYFSEKAMKHINQLGIEHLIVDLPSIDREQDNGKLACHHIFWNYPHAPITHKTITELVYVPTELKDGTYLVNIQIMSIESDASPSKIVVYKIHNS